MWRQRWVAVRLASRLHVRKAPRAHVPGVQGSRARRPSGRGEGHLRVKLRRAHLRGCHPPRALLLSSRPHPTEQAVFFPKLHSYLIGRPSWCKHPMSQESFHSRHFLAQSTHQEGGALRRVMGTRSASGRRIPRSAPRSTRCTRAGHGLRAGGRVERQRFPLKACQPRSNESSLPYSKPRK